MKSTRYLGAWGTGLGGEGYVMLVFGGDGGGGMSFDAGGRFSDSIR